MNEVEAKAVAVVVDAAVRTITAAGLAGTTKATALRRGSISIIIVVDVAAAMAAVVAAMRILLFVTYRTETNNWLLDGPANTIIIAIVSCV